MKLALVNLNRDYGDPPLGLAYIASYLRKYGDFRNIIIIDKEDIIKSIRKEKPDIIAFSSMTFEFDDVNNIAKKIKSELNIPSIIGGSHISSMPSHLIYSNFDIGIIGEGEQTMLELVQTFQKFGSFPNEELKKIKGIIYKDNGNIKTTESRPLIEPLDRIPYPARDLLKMKKYLTPRRAILPDKIGIYTQILTSRGCPYNCAFCPSSRFWQKTRFHSAEYVVNEIKEIYEKYRPDGMVIWDDLFIADKKRVEKIVSLLKSENLNENIYFSVTARANLIDRNTCKLLKEMNVKTIGFGLESGSEKILNYLKGGNVTVKQNWDAINLCKEFGFIADGYFIIGTPGETEDDLKQTLKLLNYNKLDSAKVFQLTPFPGTLVWEDAKKMGIVSDSFDFNFSQLSLDYKPEMIMTDEMNKKKFKEWYDVFQKEVVKKGHSKMVKFELKHLKYIFTPYFIKKAVMRSKELLNYAKFSKK